MTLPPDNSVSSREPPRLPPEADPEIEAVCRRKLLEAGEHAPDDGSAALWLAFWVLDQSNQNRPPGLGRNATTELHDVLGHLLGKPPARFWRFLLPDGPDGERSSCLHIEGLEPMDPIDAGLAIAEAFATQMIETVEGYDPTV